MFAFKASYNLREMVKIVVSFHICGHITGNKLFLSCFWFVCIQLSSFVLFCSPESLETFTPQKVLVIPRNRWLRLNMTEKLFTGTLNHNQNKKQTKPESSGSQVELTVYQCSGFRRHCCPQCSNISSETAWPLKAYFHVEPPWEGGTKVAFL